MKIYLVGGAVRDRLLGLEVKDRDWVVVGATPEAMIANGYRPVGKDFPVFLHPETHEEYALARTERKSGHGYRGFVFYTSPEISLEEDLIRRDLTINAMAQDKEGNIFDPFGGQKDLENHTLRHVSSAFSEDPLRVLRLARFAARFHHAGFSAANETMELMKQMVKIGEVNHLLSERVWQETARALMEPSPEIYFKILMTCEALQIIMPAWSRLISDTYTLPALKHAVIHKEGYHVRFACLFPPSESVSTKQLKVFCRDITFPTEMAELALLINEHMLALISIQKNTTATELVGLFQKTDAYRKPDRFKNALASSYHLALVSGEYMQERRIKKLLQCLYLCRSISSKPILAQGYKGKDIGKQLQVERVKQVSDFLSQQ
ncbi:MAG: polynucleotide adenylyltransferase [Candidatus Endonucleobacter bathymodioli]|uniref:CCA-adding enzyme n=1 Tax=Candidatus Endonucleibacter bathymodioli TaxID=539814 RepID=A0AA90NKA1_9GAMM|nr:polynucleotide adenylyltransferase [Candidatus Endonucleobacter bathymodioli]